MARKLSVKQKKILDSVSARFWDELSPEAKALLERLNFYETLWSDAERYLMDRSFAKQYKK